MKTLFDQAERIEIFVEGTPMTKGSLSPFLVNGQAVVDGGMTRSKKGKWITRVPAKFNMTEGSTDKARAERKRWRKTVEDAIAWEWHEVVGEMIPKHVPVRISLLFLVRRPKSVKPAKRPMPTAKLDIDKLARMMLDCMKTAKVYVDDEQVCDLHASKDYATEASATGVRIRISSM